MQRRPTLELLDTDCGSPSEVSESLKDLRWLNRWFGGVATASSMIDAAVAQTGLKRLSVLEVASGEGYVPKTLRSRSSEQGIELEFTLFDRAASHLPANGSFRKIAGDALRLPFRDSSFDLVCSSLFVHHLSPADAAGFVREGLRVCRAAVLIHDLVRHPLHLALAYAGLPLYRSRITRNDAPASVRQAYTVREMQEILQRGGAAAIAIHEHYLFRMAAIAWKEDTAS